MIALLSSTYLAVATVMSASFALPVNDADRAWSRLAAAAIERDATVFSDLHDTVVGLEVRRLEERGARQLEQFALKSAAVRTYAGPPSVSGKPVAAVYYAVLEPHIGLEPPTVWELASAFPGSSGRESTWFLIVHGCDMTSGNTLMGFAKSWRLEGPSPPSYAEFKQAMIEIFELHGEFPANTGIASTPNVRCWSVDGLAPLMGQPTSGR